jgi:hypothetical protein
VPKRPRPSSRDKPRRKPRRRAGAPLPPRPPAAARPRVAPVTSQSEALEQPKPRIPGAIDFSYVGGELRRILILGAGVIILLVVLSFVLR